MAPSSGSEILVRVIEFYGGLDKGLGIVGAASAGRPWAAETPNSPPLRSGGSPKKKSKQQTTTTRLGFYLVFGASPALGGVATFRSSLFARPLPLVGSGPSGPLLHIARPMRRLGLLPSGRKNITQGEAAAGQAPTRIAKKGLPI